MARRSANERAEEGGGTLPEVVAVEVQPLQLHEGVAVEERHVGSSPLDHCKGGESKEDTRFTLGCFTVTEIQEILVVPFKGAVSATAEEERKKKEPGGIKTFSAQGFKQNTFLHSHRKIEKGKKTCVKLITQAATAPQRTSGDMWSLTP